MNSSERDDYKQKGAQLPEALRAYAKRAHIIRDNEGVHLYDENWTFITSLKVSSKRNQASGPAVTAGDASPKSEHLTVEEPVPQEILSGEALNRQVKLVVDRFRHAVTLHGIRADYFFENRLSRSWVERWERIWKGDLSPLLEDTQDFMPGQDLNTRESGGLDTLKAALIHELYVNSTLAGRSNGEKESDSGRNMLNLLLFVCQLNRNGELDDVGQPLSEGLQMQLIDSFQKMGDCLQEKKWMLQRVHQKLVFDFKRGRIWPDTPTAAAVKSALIFKLYENTNRLDRGDGTDMVRIVRGVIGLQLAQG